MILRPAIMKQQKPKGRVFGTRASPTLVSIIEKKQRLDFESLGLDKIETRQAIGKTRTRTHTNPLSHEFRHFEMTQKWESIFENPSKPLFLDIGCAAGKFCLMAASDSNSKPTIFDSAFLSSFQTDKPSEMNHLGLEIRKPLVTRANFWAKELKLGNCGFLVANVASAISKLLTSYPGQCAVVSVQFPDPHFKKKHHKRRVVDSLFVSNLAKLLSPSARVFLQSDVEEACSQMRDRFLISEYFDIVGNYSERSELFPPEIGASDDSEKFWTKNGKASLRDDYGGWLLDGNPLNISTERESQNLGLNQPIYRCIFSRNEKPFVPSQEYLDALSAAYVKDLKAVCHSFLAHRAQAKDKNPELFALLDPFCQSFLLISKSDSPTVVSEIERLAQELLTVQLKGESVQKSLQTLKAILKEKPK